MTPIYPNSPPSPFPQIESSSHDHYEVHQHLHFSSPSQASSSSSLSFPILFNPTQDQGGNFDTEEDQQEVANKYILHGGSSSSSDPHQFFSSPSLPTVESIDHESNYGGLKLSICKQETEDNKDHDDDHNRIEIGSSVKWMSSKMRLMRKMMNNPKRIVADTSKPNKFDQDHHQQSSSDLFNIDNSTNNFSKYNNNNINSTIRVCADCNTTKTPLWRSGPRGPKSLCNACGIRQRKARRAMAAAAAAAAAAATANNGTVQLATDRQEASTSIKTKGVHQKEIKIKRSSSSSENGGYITQYKKRCKIVAPPPSGISSSSSSSRKKLCFEDFTISLMSKNNSAFHQVFPQDEKEAAILLMALSYGLVHG